MTVTPPDLAGLRSLPFFDESTYVEGAAIYSDTFLTQSGKPADKGLEGFLFPDTYDVARHSSDDSDVVIKTMLKQMESNFTPDMISDRTRPS